MYSKLLQYLILFVSSCSAEVRLQCPLEWTDFSTDDYISTHSLVAAHPGEYFVARILNSGVQKIGCLEHAIGVAHINNASYTSFQLLTNPNGCTVKWVPSSSLKSGQDSLTLQHAVSSGSPSEYIGRVLLDKVWLGGPINLAPSETQGSLNLGKIWIEILGFDPKMNLHYSNYQVLISYSQGLSLELNGFFLHSNNLPKESLEFLSMEEIRNLGSVDMNKTIYHSKRVSESISLTHSLPQDITDSVNINVNFWFMNDNFILSDYSGDFENRILTHTKEKEMTVSANLNINPSVSLSVCSLVSLMDDFESEYTANAIYKGKGMSGNEVKSVLNQFNLTGGLIKGNGVVVKTSGVLVVSAALQTKFFTFPFTGVHRAGCEVLKKEAHEFSVEKAKRKFEKDLERLEKINVDQVGRLNRKGIVRYVNYTRDSVTESGNLGIEISMEGYRTRRAFLEENGRLSNNAYGYSGVQQQKMTKTYFKGR